MTLISSLDLGKKYFDSQFHERFTRNGDSYVHDTFVTEIFVLFHFSFQSSAVRFHKNSKRRQCPGCNETFDKRYFIQHTHNFYNEDTKSFSCSKPHSTAQSDDEASFSFVDLETERSCNRSPEFEIPFENESDSDRDTDFEKQNILSKKMYASFLSQVKSAKNLSERDRADFFDDVREDMPDSDDEDFDTEDGIYVMDDELQEIENEPLDASNDTSRMSCEVRCDNSLKTVFVCWLSIFIVVCDN